jgi:predicted molibdopterin-dependent oxidoreductase YjgC
MNYGTARAHQVKKVTTTCSYCGVGCQFDLLVKNNKVIGVQSNPDAPVNGMALCVKGRYGYDYIHHPDRLLKPKVRRYLLEGKTKQESRDQRTESSELLSNHPLSKNTKLPSTMGRETVPAVPPKLITLAV